MPVVRATGKQRQEDCHELEASLGYLVRPSCFKITKQSVGRISVWTWDPARRRDNPLSVWGQLEQRDKDNVFISVGINSQLNVFMYMQHSQPEPLHFGWDICWWPGDTH